MKNSTKASGAAIATAAALLFGTLTATTASGAEEAKVKCAGVNSCKGHSACATAQNACAGQNACKGKGYLSLTQSQCDAAKASMEKDKK